MSEIKKIGRPTESLKKHVVRTHVDDRELEILDNYCKINEKKRAEALRDAIELLKEEEEE